ncbi:uncharacterized protein TNCV_3710211 [Trichonephila clavipes]|nr:uncharacterized protein TNCV_3710211 [Trichonephila clavipes]
MEEDGETAEFLTDDDIAAAVTQEPMEEEGSDDETQCDKDVVPHADGAAALALRYLEQQPNTTPADVLFMRRWRNYASSKRLSSLHYLCTTSYLKGCKKKHLLADLRKCYTSVGIKKCLAEGSLVVRALESRPEGLGSMPPNTLRVHTEYVLVKSVGLKVLWAESRVQGTGEYFPPLKIHGKVMEAEIGGVAIYRPFVEFRRSNSCCHMYGAQSLVPR